MKKIVLLIFASLLLLSMFGVVCCVAPGKAEPRTVYVDSGNVGDPLEDGSFSHPFDKIQKGIDAAVSGDTVFVSRGTYYEWNVVLDKDNLSLVGENKDNTVIDGMNYGWILVITAQNVTVTGFTIQKSPIGTAGIFLNHAIESEIRNNVIKNHDSGIYSAFSNGNIIENNWVANNNEGIILSSVCKENKVIGNNVTGNTLFAGIDLSNGAHNNKIENNNIAQNKYGILIAFENDSISGNRIMNNGVGVYEYSESTRGYKIFHNNFINNTKQVDLHNQSVNIWDNGIEGNYWSDYNGTDLDQDGIGDVSKVINVNNTDRFPLMGVFSDFPVTWEEETYHTTTISNSSISAFEFDQVNRVVTFNVTGGEGTGFCRVCIPHDLMGPPYTVTVNGYSPQHVNYTLYNNGTHSWIYFTYLHSTREVTIVPEFPTWPLLSLLLIVITSAIAIYRWERTFGV